MLAKLRERLSALSRSLGIQEALRDRAVRRMTSRHKGQVKAEGQKEAAEDKAGELRREANRSLKYGSPTYDQAKGERLFRRARRKEKKAQKLEAKAEREKRRSIEWKKRRDEFNSRIKEIKDEVSGVKAKIGKQTPLRVRALRVAEGLVGVMEQGGNNTGPIIDKIIRANGGVIGEPWCGDFCAYCYRLAGSKAVQRLWAAVRALFGLFGIKRVSTPRPGDLVRFTFDHVGLFAKDNGDGTITTIEGNTGASGAVSDSATGGDGVYRKVRDKSLVNDYLRVTR